MTRKSALPTVAPLKNMGPPAPRDLPLPSQALWAEICGSLPSSYFTPGDLPLLRAFCLASHHKAGADALVQRQAGWFNGCAYLKAATVPEQPDTPGKRFSEKSYVCRSQAVGL